MSGDRDVREGAYLKTTSRAGRPWLYRLMEEESQREILVMVDLHGFFEEEKRVNPDQVRMLGTSFPLTAGTGALDDVELQVLDFRGEVIGAYYVGSVQVMDARPAAGGDGTDLLASFFGHSLPFPFAGEIWRRWSSRFPSAVGEWKKIPARWHRSWLHVVQNAWFQAGRAATRNEIKPTYTLEGADLANVASFYCSLGEAMNGPGGYFGSNLDALADCLANATAVDGDFEIVWSNREVSARTIGDTEMAAIVGVFRDFRIPVRF